RRNDMSRRVTRRSFLKATAATAAIASRPRFLIAADGATPTAVNVALIGAGGKGLDNTRKIAEAGAKIVAFCDIDPSRMSDALKTSPTAKTYTDFRKMLETQKDIEAVIVTVPDHMHAFAAMRAIEMGKHVYCEKPLAHSIFEARTLREGAAKKK